jgi:hypothetical protein
MRKRLASPRGRIAFAAVAACLVVLLSLAASGASDVRSGDRLSFALTGARVLAAPGRTFDPGVVVVRGGVIEAVGPAGKVAVPADARVFDLRGRVVHAAFDFRYSVVAAYVDGRPLDLSDRHKRLYERYKNRPKPAGAK